MSFLDNLWKKPESVRKFIFWTIMIVIGTGLSAFWAWSSYREIKVFSGSKFIEKLNIPSSTKEQKGFLEMENKVKESVEQIKKSSSLKKNNL